MITICHVFKTYLEPLFYQEINKFQNKMYELLIWSIE